MNVTKLRNAADIDKAAMAAVNAALNANAKDIGDGQIQADKPAQAASPTELTADGASEYLQGITAISCSAIDALIRDLFSLRDKLVVERGRIEQDVVEYASVNQSVVRLTEMVGGNVAHVKAPNLSPP